MYIQTNTLLLCIIIIIILLIYMSKDKENFDLSAALIDLATY